jgi:hypothetical protein
MSDNKTRLAENNAMIDDAIEKARALPNAGGADVTAESITTALGYVPADQAAVERLSEAIADYGTLTLDVYTDGLVYIFKNGVPVGNGVKIYTDAPITAYIDSEKNLILRENIPGALPDGVYIAKYIMEDGSLVSIGELNKDTNVYYSVTNNLTNCTNSNNDTQVIEGQAYTATITAKSGYELKSVTVTMGGSSVTVSGGVIHIVSVTGNIVITAVAEDVKAAYNNIANANSTNKPDWEQWINDARIGSDGKYRLESGASVSGWILLKAGQTVYWQGLNTTDSADFNGSGVYTTSKAVTAVASMVNQTAEFSNISVTANGGQATAKKDLYLRLVCKTPTDMSAVIITIDEPIV